MAKPSAFQLWSLMLPGNRMAAFVSAAAGVIVAAVANSPAAIAPGNTYLKLFVIIAPSVLTIVAFISVIFREPRTKNRMQIRRQQREYGKLNPDDRGDRRFSWRALMFRAARHE